jgi:Tfp pilus assembly protein PilF
VSVILDALRRNTRREEDDGSEQPTARTDAVLSTLGYAPRPPARRRSLGTLLFYGMCAIGAGFLGLTAVIFWLAPPESPAPTRQRTSDNALRTTQAAGAGVARRASGSTAAAAPHGVPDLAPPQDEAVEAPSAVASGIGAPASVRTPGREVQAGPTETRSAASAPAFAPLRASGDTPASAGSRFAREAPLSAETQAPRETAPRETAPLEPASSADASESAREAFAPRAAVRTRATAVAPGTAGPTTAARRASSLPAEAEAPASIERTPSPVDHFGLALYYQRVGNFDDALTQYRALLEQNDASAEVHNNLGLLYGDHGQGDLALEQFRRAIAIDPRYVKAHDNLGVALMRGGDLTGAAAEFRVVLAADPREVEAMVNLALVQKASGRTPEARDLLQRAVALDPRSAGSHYNLAVVADENGDAVTAIEHYRAFLRYGAVAHHDLTVQVRARLAALGG